MELGDGTLERSIQNMREKDDYFDEDCVSLQ